MIKKLCDGIIRLDLEDSIEDLKLAAEVYREVRPWGQFTQFPTESPVNLKEIAVNPGQRLSLQSHEFRDELWIFPNNGLTAEIISPDGFQTFISPNPDISNPATLFIPRGWKHRLINKNGEIRHVIEISYGEFQEDDIERFDDDYGRK